MEWKLGRRSKGESLSKYACNRKLRKQPTLPRNDVWGTSVDFPYWWHVITRIWVVLLIGRTAREIEALPRTGWHVISMEFRGETTNFGCYACKPFLPRHFITSTTTASTPVSSLSLRLAPAFKRMCACLFIDQGSLFPVFTASVSSQSIREPAYNNAFLCTETESGREG